MMIITQIKNLHSGSVSHLNHRFLTLRLQNCQLPDPGLPYLRSWYFHDFKKFEVPHLKFNSHTAKHTHSHIHIHNNNNNKQQQ